MTPRLYHASAAAHFDDSPKWAILFAMLALEFIAQTIAGQPVEGAHPVSEVVIDSRRVTPGGVFFALQGERVDGHQYVGDAFKQGAIAAIIDQDVEAPCPVLDLRRDAAPNLTSLDTPVCLRVDSSVLALQEAGRQWVRRFPQVRIIGVTGSVGKSTTKELVADVLSLKYKTLRSEGSYNNELGIPLTVLKLDDTVEKAVLEMSMYTIGEIALLTGIAPPQVGVVTLIAPVHLERAGSMENIIKAKTELVEALPPGPEGVAIFNRDDDNVMSMADHTQAQIVTYGEHPSADFRASDIEGLGLDGIRFWLHAPGTADRQLHLRLLGRHSVHTARRAAAVGIVEGMRWGEIVEGLQTSQNQLRLLAIKGPNNSIILDDTYNASPSSTLAALNLLNDLMEGRRLAVLGDMLELGAYEEMGHARVGVRASAVADLLVTVGQRARIIAREAIRAGMPIDTVEQFDTAEEAAEFLMGVIEPGDAILVKGSRAVGMERIVSHLNLEARREE